MTEAETMSDKNLIAALCREVLDTFPDQRKDRSRFLELRAELESRLAAARPAGDRVTISADVLQRLVDAAQVAVTVQDITAKRQRWREAIHDAEDALYATPAPGGPEEV